MNSNIARAIEVFNKGGIVIFPTDTAYGIGCRMDNEESIQRLYEMRSRPANKPILALVNSISMAEEYTDFTTEAKKFAKEHWPGPLTVILKCKKEKVPENARAKGDTLAIRLPDNKIMQEIISMIGVPILAPSANSSGEPTPYSLSEVSTELIKKADFVLEGEGIYRKESTIIDTSVSPWKIVRAGAVKVVF